MEYSKQDTYSNLYRPETDVQLPRHLDSRTRYMYFKVIARGGKCIISSCKDLHLRRTVCHKALKEEFANNPAEQARFLREARVTAMLQHPNTVPTYELGRDAKGNYFFTMKLVHGHTLREVISLCTEKRSQVGSQFDLRRRIDILTQVFHALHFAHFHGVVHRDIKPENILVGRFGEVMLLDWGAAKVWENATRDDREASKPISKLAKIDLADESIALTRRLPNQGTPPHLSPEQIQDSFTVDHRTDIYSMGTVLFEILALERMFKGNTARVVMDRIQNQEFERPSLLRPDLNIPQELEKVCLRCTLPKPDDRYQSASDVIDALESWKETPSSTRDPSLGVAL